MTVMQRLKDLVLSKKRRVLLCSSGFLFRGILRSHDRAGAQLFRPFLSSSQSRFGDALRDLMARDQSGKAQTTNRALPGALSSLNNTAFVAQRAQRRYHSSRDNSGCTPGLPS